MNDSLQEPFQGIRLCGAEEAKYTAMGDGRGEARRCHGGEDAEGEPDVIME
jgi:hypothetical protein